MTTQNGGAGDGSTENDGGRGRASGEDRATGTGRSTETVVHRPGDGGAGSSAAVPSRAGAPLAGSTGWAVLALVLVCFVGFPVAIVLWPPTFVPYTDAYLALAFVPGLLLGLAAVWMTLRARR